MLTAALAHHLTTLGVEPGLVFDAAGCNVFLEDLPPEGFAVGIYAQMGPQPKPFVGLRRPYVQIIVRGDGSAGRARTGQQVAQAILEALDDSGHLVWGEGTPDAVRIAWCLALQSQPVDLGVDGNGQPRWSVRYEIETTGKAA